jgi:hypothetical protein
MRKVSEVTQFAFKHSSNCYIEVAKDGTVSNPLHKNDCDINEIQGAYERALSGLSVLYVTFSGTYAGKLFLVDDLDALAKAFDFHKDEGCRHSFKWKVVNPNDMSSKEFSVPINMSFDCGCMFANIDELDTFLTRRVGWTISKSKEWAQNVEDSKLEVIANVNKRTLKSREQFEGEVR